MDTVQRCQAGEEGAFEALFEEYKNLVYRTAYLMLGTTHEAEDALQEVFLKVHRSLRSYDPRKGAFTTWLHRITMNHCLNQRRKRHPAPLESVDAGEALASQQPSAEQRVESDDSLRRALAHLSQKLRAVLVLRYYLDLSYDEISQILGAPVGTVKSRIHSALAALRRELTDEAFSAARASGVPGAWQQGEAKQ
jgi:RNA polymerase sigma-70 factor (ECF subfamily)